MTSKRYLRLVLGLVLGIGLPFIGFNLWQDDFGLFWSAAERRIWTLEKTSKYLLSFRYIPRHFDGLLIGPSYSDGLMDTRKLVGHRIYNLSMDAGNATELRAAALNAIERGKMRVVIICLSPYLTNNSGMKGPQINGKEYWGSLFSWLPIDVLVAKLQIKLGLIEDVFAGSEWGMGNMLRRDRDQWAEFARKQRAASSEINADPAAYADLEAIIEAARARGARIFAYFYPYNHWRMQSYAEAGLWAAYRARTLTLFDDRYDVVWDMNEPAYDAMTHDPACYTDGHLSQAGADLVLAEIRRRLDQSESAMADPYLLSGKFKRWACLGQPGAGSGYDRSPEEDAEEPIASGAE